MTKEKLYGYAGSSAVCLLIFLILQLTSLKTAMKVEDEGVFVNFGTVDLASGTFEPRSDAPPTENNKPEPAQPVIPHKKMSPVAHKKAKTETHQAITQNREKTAAIEAEQKKQAEKKRLEAEQQAQRKKAEAEQQKREQINKQVSGAFGQGTAAQKQQTGGTGNARSAASAGTGYGEFNLGGRSVGAGGLPRPAYTVPEEGRIVIDITVDPKGNVIFAEIGKGTNIGNVSLRRSALDAAKKAKFSGISGNNNQSGTITYHYSLK